MKYCIILLLLIALGAGGYFFFSKNSPQISQVPTANPSANCTEGVDGNTGDNFCSNYRGPGSKCTPRMSNTYPDGCTKE